MVIIGLEPIVKVKYVTYKVGEQSETVPQEKIVGYNKYKLEIDEIFKFRQMISESTKKPYKNKCLLFTNEGWIPVNHSFEELLKFKQILHKKIEIKGFYDKNR